MFIKMIIMLKEVINIIRDAALRHKGVCTFGYKGDDLFNAQNNNRMYQVYVDDVSLHELNITSNIFKASFEVYVLGFPGDDSPVLDVQDNAYTIACDIMAYIDTREEYYGILSVYDYSILTLSRFTDDNAAGVKLSLVLQMPSPVNLCELGDNFNDEPYHEEPDMEIDINNEEVGDIDIRPIRLIRNRQC